MHTNYLRHTGAVAKRTGIIFIAILGLNKKKIRNEVKNGASSELTAIHTPDLYKERSNHSKMRRGIISKNECNW